MVIFAMPEIKVKGSTNEGIQKYYITKIEELQVRRLRMASSECWGSLYGMIVYLPCCVCDRMSCNTLNDDSYSLQ